MRGVEGVDGLWGCAFDWVLMRGSSMRWTATPATALRGEENPVSVRCITRSCAGCGDSSPNGESTGELLKRIVMGIDGRRGCSLFCFFPHTGLSRFFSAVSSAADAGCGCVGDALGEGGRCGPSALPGEPPGDGGCRDLLGDPPGEGGWFLWVGKPLGEGGCWGLR